MTNDENTAGQYRQNDDPGAAEEAGIVDQQDAVLHEMEKSEDDESGEGGPGESS